MKSCLKTLARAHSYFLINFFVPDVNVVTIDLRCVYRETERVDSAALRGGGRKTEIYCENERESVHKTCHVTPPTKTTFALLLIYTREFDPCLFNSIIYWCTIL